MSNIQIRCLDWRQTGRRKHRVAQRVGDPDRIVSVHARRRPAESYRCTASVAGDRQGRRHTVPQSVRRVVEAWRTDARPHFDHLHLPGRYSLRLVRRNVLFGRVLWNVVALLAVEPNVVTICLLFVCFVIRISILPHLSIEYLQARSIVL